MYITYIIYHINDIHIIFFNFSCLLVWLVNLFIRSLMEYCIVLVKGLANKFIPLKDNRPRKRIRPRFGNEKLLTIFRITFTPRWVWPHPPTPSSVSSDLRWPLEVTMSSSRIFHPIGVRLLEEKDKILWKGIREIKKVDLQWQTIRLLILKILV